MAVTVRLTVMEGPHVGRRFCFCGPNHCNVGRGSDCFIQFAGGVTDELISRHHCVLDIDPPGIRLWDLGSLNGTCINGAQIVPSLQALFHGNVVNDGDLISVGATTLRLDLVDCPHAEKDEEGRPVWEGGRQAKKDCPLPCGPI